MSGPPSSQYHKTKPSMTTLLVGCGGGIGSAIAQRLSHDGFTVIGVDKSEVISQYLQCCYESDFNHAEQILSACEKISNDYTGLWAIIFCAGVYPIVDFQRYTLQLWDEVHNVNVRAAFIISQRLGPMLLHGGRIVAIASGASHLGSRDVAYSSSKAALIGLCRSLAFNLSDKMIRVNVVCPGPIDTNMSRRMPIDRILDYKNRILLKRFGTPKEVAYAVEFLVDPENTYINGATIDINGGLYMR